MFTRKAPLVLLLVLLALPTRAAETPTSTAQPQQAPSGNPILIVLAQLIEAIDELILESLESLPNPTPGTPEFGGYIPPGG